MPEGLERSPRGKGTPRILKSRIRRIPTVVLPVYQLRDLEWKTVHLRHPDRLD
jgi:hypothetical protein